MSDVSTRIGITPVVQGGAGARSELAALWQEFKAGKLSVEEFNQEMRNLSGAIYAQRRVVMLLRTEYRNTRAALYEAMRGFRAVATIGRTITSTYQTYTLMQIRVADKTRDIRDAQEDLASIQVRRQRVVKDLGADNAIALRLMNEEDRLTKRLTDDKRDLKRAQDQNRIGYIGIGLQTLRVIPSMVSLARHIALTKTYIEAEWGVTGLRNIITVAKQAELSIFGVKMAYSSLATLLAIPLTIYVGYELMQSIADIVNEDLRKLGLPITEKRPGDPGMRGIWPGVYLDEDLLDAYREYEERRAATKPTAQGIWPGVYIEEVTVDGEDIDVQVDVTVTQTGERDRGEGGLR